MADGPTGEGASGDLTLAFELQAAAAVVSPRAVFADARRWSRHVGIVGHDPAAVDSFVRRHGLRQDYELADLDPVNVLSRLKWEADTDRFVYVGRTDRASALADHVNWEYIALVDAAEAAGWTLRAEAGIVDRLRAVVARRLPRG